MWSGVEGDAELFEVAGADAVVGGKVRAGFVEIGALAIRAGLHFEPIPIVVSLGFHITGKAGDFDEDCRRGRAGNGGQEHCQKVREESLGAGSFHGCEGGKK